MEAMLPGQIPQEFSSRGLALGVQSAVAGAVLNCSLSPRMADSLNSSCCYNLDPLPSVQQDDRPRLCISPKDDFLPSSALSVRLASFDSSPFGGTLAAPNASSLPNASGSIEETLELSASTVPVLATPAISVSLSSEGASIAIGQLRNGLFWLPKLPPSKLVLNRARASLPPYTCLEDGECSGSAWQEVSGRCISGACACPLPAAGIDCAREQACLHSSPRSPVVIYELLSTT